MNTPRLTQNLWERFGFRDNPYDTRALSLSPESALSVAEAFVGRGAKSHESQLLTNFLRNPGGVSVLGSGITGGKSKTTTVHRGKVSATTLKQYLDRLP